MIILVNKIEKEILGISLDNDTDEMKTLFEYMFEKFEDKFVSKHDVIELIKFENNLFNYIDWNSKSDQTKFGIKLNKVCWSYFVRY